MSFAPPSQSQSSTAPIVPPPPHPPAPNPVSYARSTPLSGFDPEPTQPTQHTGFPGTTQQPATAASDQTAFPPASYQPSPFPPTSYQPAPGAAYAPMASTRSRRSGTSALVMALVIVGPVVAVSATVWAVLRSRDAANQAEQDFDQAVASANSVLADAQDTLDDIAVSVPAVTLPVIPEVPGISDVDASVPAVSLPEVAVPAVVAVSLFDPAGATAVIGTYEAAIGATPTEFLTVTMYPDYAVASAQDPANPLHIDSYDYRDGFVGAPSPVTLVGEGDLEANLFASTDVDWTFLSRAVAEAPSLMPTVEEGAVTHIIVERSVFTPDFSITVRVYVSGPRGGGYVEYTAAGELIQVMV